MTYIFVFVMTSIVFYLLLKILDNKDNHKDINEIKEENNEDCLNELEKKIDFIFTFNTIDSTEKNKKISNLIESYKNKVNQDKLNELRLKFGIKIEKKNIDYNQTNERISSSVIVNPLNWYKYSKIANRVEETILYELVLDEIDEGIKIRGLWAKAIAMSNGDNNKATSIYMQYRVQDIKDYFTTLKLVYKDLSKQQIKEKVNNPNFTDNENNPEKKQVSLKSKENYGLLEQLYLND